MRGRRLNQQTIAALIVAGVLLIGGVLIFGDDLPLIGTAGDTPTPEAQQVLDTDNDGINNRDDPCPNIPNDSVGDPCNPDEDSDGVNDTADVCPTEGDLGFGLQADGCPVRDNDGDGIGNDADACPDQGDQGFGLQADGCPVLDNDGDGIGNDVDPCPDIANDNVGDPCNPDEDADGINDDVDVCPQQGDEGNGVDGQGCPIAPATEEPTDEPTEVAQETEEPTPEPTEVVTEEPTPEPTEVVTEEPTEEPSAPDVVTEEPTEEPTPEPTEVVTEEPTEEPTEVVTEEPTEEPTEVVTEEPTEEPTEVVTEEPTEEPTEVVTEEPTEEPTEVVTEEPTEEPTEVVTEEPTEEPTEVVTEEPTEEPTEVVTEEPTEEPTEAAPTRAPVGAQGGQGAVTGAQALPQANASFDAFVRADGTVEFTDQSTPQSAIVSWQWQFGDGNGSNAQNPTHIYSEAGTYTVTLTVRGDNGIPSTAAAGVTVTEEEVAPMTCRFDMSIDDSNPPDFVVTFTNLSTNVAEYEWLVNGTQASTSRELAPQTFGFGDHSIILNCTDAADRTLQATGSLSFSEDQGALDPVVARIIAEPTRGAAPLTVDFNSGSTSDESDPIVSWAWTITGPGGTNITFDVADPAPVELTEPGIYDVSLIVTTENGRSSNATGSVEAVQIAEKPIPGITANPVVGELDENGEFTTAVAGTNTGGPVETWTWNYGGGTAATTDGQNPGDVTFTAVGTYTITLNVEGPGGTGTATQQIIVAEPGEDITANFRYELSDPAFADDGTPNQVCFFDQSVGTVSVYTWTFANLGEGGPPVPASADVANPCVDFPVQGSYSATLRVEGPGGEFSNTTQTIPLFSGVPAPDAAFDVSATQITVGDTVTFTNQTTGTYTLLEWEVDGNTDNGFDETGETVTVTYDVAGNYNVFLRATGPGGFSEATAVQIIVSDEEVVCVLNGNNPGRVGQNRNFSFDVTGATPTSYNWVVNRTFDGSTTQYASGSGSSLGVNFTDPGSYTISVQALDENGAVLEATAGLCEAERSFTIDWRDLVCPTPNGPTTVGVGTTHEYQLRINRLDGDDVTNIMWTVGDDSVEIANSGNRTTDVTFNETGTFTLSATVETASGRECNPSITVEVVGGISGCSFDGWDATVVAGQEVTYTANVNNPAGLPLTYVWTENGSASLGGSSYTVTWMAGEQTLTVDVYVGDFTLAEVAGIEPDCSGGVGQTIDVGYGQVTCPINNVSNRNALPGESTRITAAGSAGGYELEGDIRYRWTITRPAGDDRETVITTESNQLNLDGLVAGEYTVTYVKVLVTDEGEQVLDCAADTVTITVGFPEELVCQPPRRSTDRLVTPGTTVTWTERANELDFDAEGVTFTWTWQLFQITEDGPVLVDDSSTGTNPNDFDDYVYASSIDDAGLVYAVGYTVVVTDSNGNLIDDCSSGTREVEFTGESFTCEDFRIDADDNAADGFEGTPANPGNNYTYRIVWDNAEPANVEYAWDTGGNGTISGSGRQIQVAWNTAGIFTLNATVSSADDSVVCPASIGIYSGHSLDVSFDGTPQTVLTGEEICLDNTTRVRGPEEAYTWNWDLAGGTITTGATTTSRSDNGELCVSWDTPGPKSVTLTGAIPGIEDTDTDEFSVVARANIEATVIGSDVALRNEVFNIEATGNSVDLTQARWSVVGSDTTSRGPNFSVSFPEAGNYEIQVEAPITYNDQTLSASVNVQVVESNSIQADFTPNPRTGQASEDNPLRVCFTDLSTIQDQLVSWTWDFGNGDSLSYTDANIPAEICTEYTQPGDYNVTLDIENSTGLTADAGRTVSAFSPRSASGSIGAEIFPEGQVCYEAEVVGNFTITGWNFGDPDGEGNVIETSSASECYVYSETGTYTVTLNLTDGELPYTLQRTVNVRVFTDEELPRLSVEAQCVQQGPPGSVSIEITNTGGPIPEDAPAIITITESDGTPVDTVQLTGEQSHTQTYTGLFNGVEITAQPYEIFGDTTIGECWDRSSLEVTYVCNIVTNEDTGVDQYLVEFSVRNTGEAPMQGTAPFTVWSDGYEGGNVVTEGNIPALNGRESTTVFSRELGENEAYYFQAEQRPGHPGTGRIRADSTGGDARCEAPPTGSLTVTKSVDLGDNEFELNDEFTINITGPDSFSETITLSDGESRTLDDLQPGTYTVTETDPGPAWDVSGEGAVEVEAGGEASATITNTFTAPELSASGVCVTNENLVRFTITNASDTPITDGSWNVTDESGNTVDSNDAFSFEGNQTTVDVPFVSFGLNRSLTITVNDGFGNEASSSAIGPCIQRVTITSICWETSETHEFRVSNPNPFPVTVEVVNNSIGQTTFGPQEVAASTSVTYTGERATPNILYVLDENGTRYEHSRNSTNNERCEEPLLSVEGTCDNNAVASFVISNEAEASGDMFGTGTYEVNAFNAEENPVASGEFSLATGESTDPIVVEGFYGDVSITVTYTEAGSDFPGSYTFSDTANTNCGNPPSLSISGECVEGAPVATIVNNGGAMYDLDATYTVTYEDTGETSAPISITGLDSSEELTLNLEQNRGAVTVSLATERIPVNIEINTATIDYCNPPALVITGQCDTENQVPTASITNNGGQMLDSTTVTVTYEDGGNPQTITIDPLGPDGSVDISDQLSNARGALTLVLDPEFAAAETPTTVSLENCNESEIGLNVQCDGTNVIGEITNNGGPLLEDLTYTITYEYPDANGQTTVSGTVEFEEGRQVLDFSNERGDVTLSIAELQLTASTENCFPPDLTLSGVCEGTSPVASIVNDGGPAQISGTYTVTYSEGTANDNVEASFGPLNAGEDFPIPNLRNDLGDVSITMAYPDGEQSDEITIENCFPPQPDFSLACVDGTDVILTLDNTNGGPMFEELTLNVTYANGPNDTVPFQLDAGETDTITLANDLGDVTVSIESELLTRTADVTSCNPPEITFSAQCDAERDLGVVTVVNSGGPMFEPEFINVEYENGETSQIEFQFDDAGSQTFDLDPNKGSATVSYGEQEAQVVPYCNPPALDITHQCVEVDEGQSFVEVTVTNSGGAMLEEQVIDVLYEDGETAQLPFTLGEGGETSFDLDANRGGATLTLAQDGFDPIIVPVPYCEPPDLQLTGQCVDDAPTAVVVNNGGQMLEGTTVSVEYSAGDPTTIDIPALGPGEEFPLTDQLSDQFGNVSLSLEGQRSSIDLENCNESNVSLNVQCEGTNLVGSIDNLGGPMLDVLSYTVDYQFGEQDFSNEIQLGEGESEVLDLTNTLGTVTVSFDGTEISASAENCFPPEPVLEGVCEGTTPVASILNSNGPTHLDGSYTITYEVGDPVEGTFPPLTAGEEFPIDGLSNERGDITITLQYPAEGRDDVTTVTDEISIENCFPPQPDFNLVCEEGTDIVLTLDNSQGGPMLDPIVLTVDYEVGDDTTIDFQLDQGETERIVLNNDQGNVTVGAFDPALTKTLDVTDCNPPVLRAEPTCLTDEGAPVPAITVFNDGGPMYSPAEYPWNATYAFDLPAESGMVSVPAGESVTLEFSNLGGAVSFEMPDFGIEASATTDNCYPPELRVEAQCDGTAAYVEVFNDGGPMAEPDVVMVDYAQDDEGAIEFTFELGAESSQRFDLDNDKGAITVMHAGTETIIDVENCNPPSLTFDAYCEGNTPIAEVTNNGGPMFSEETLNIDYEVGDDTTISFMLDEGETETYTLNNDQGNVSVTLNSLEETIDVENCFPPELALDGVCEGNTPVVTLTNSGGPIITPVSLTVEYETGDTATIEGIQLDADSNARFELDNDKGDVTVTLNDGSEEQRSISIDNCFPPELALSGVCDTELNAGIITVVNNGGPMLASETVEVTYQTGETASFDFQLDQAGTETFQIDSDKGTATASLTYSTDAGVLDQTIEFDNCFPPEVSASAVCEETEPVISITNDGGPFIDPTSYVWSVVYQTGVTAEGEITVAPGATETVTLSNEEGSFTFSIPELGINIERDTCWPPDLTASGVCVPETGEATFTVVNTGGPTIEDVTYTLSDETGTIESGVISLDNGEEFSTTTVTPGTLTFEILEFSETVTTICFEEADIEIAGFCNDDASATFTIFNRGGDMALSDDEVSWQVFNQDNVQVLEGSVVLGEDAQEMIFVPFVEGTFALEIQLASGPSARTTVADCVPETPTTATPVAEVPDVCGEIIFDEYGFPIVDMDPAGCDDTPLTRAPWTPLSIGEATCPDWLIYHTNTTGNWEIFRLGGDDEFPDDNPNLSQGDETPRIHDFAPSRSPDGQWIAFASVRDGNWEIYVAPVDNVNSGNIIQRVTYNDVAVDIDPVWSPGADADGGNYVVYESARDGQYDLYLLDVRTGMERQLTDSPASDINAFWHPDGTKLLFQSDRDRAGIFQIYELDLSAEDENGFPVTTRLSDGEGNDRDAMYSNEGDRILFRRTASPDSSVIYVMDSDGQNVEMVSDPAGFASNAVWSPDDEIFAYQSNLDGDLDIYAYEFESEVTRLITENDIPDYSPTWYCESTEVVFTSDVDSTEERLDANIFSTNALPIDADAIIVDEEANRLTTAEELDQHPQNSPAEENASRGGE